MKNINRLHPISSVKIGSVLLATIFLFGLKSFGSDESAVCSCSIGGNAYGYGSTKSDALSAAMPECTSRTQEYSYNWSKGNQACIAAAQNAIGGALFGCRHTTTEYGTTNGRVGDCR